MKGIRKYFANTEVKLILYFDQLNAAYSNDVLHQADFNEFFVKKFSKYFDHFLGFVSATNDVVVKKQLSKTPKQVSDPCWS